MSYAEEDRAAAEAQAQAQARYLAAARAAYGPGGHARGSGRRTRAEDVYPGASAERLPPSRIPAAEVEQAWIIGRARECEELGARIDDASVDPFHCRVSMLVDGSVRVEDLGSQRGTVVKNRSGRVSVGVEPVVLRQGDAIMIGGQRIPWNR